MNCQNRKKLINKYFEKPEDYNLLCIPIRDGKNYYNQYNTKDNIITKKYKILEDPKNNLEELNINKWLKDNILKWMLNNHTKLKLFLKNSGIEKDYIKIKNNNFSEDNFKRLLFFIFNNLEKFLNIDSIEIKKKKINTQNRINRILFILNYVYNENRLITSLELYNKIINEFEKDNKFTMDKKTLSKILVDLEDLNLIKIKKYIIKVDDFKNLEDSFEIKKWIIYLPNKEVSNNEFEKLDFLVNPFKNQNQSQSQSFETKIEFNKVDEDKFNLIENIDPLNKIIEKFNLKIKNLYYQRIKAKIFIKDLKLKNLKVFHYKENFNNFLENFDINRTENKKCNFDDLEDKLVNFFIENKISIKNLNHILENYVNKYNFKNICISENYLEKKIKEKVCISGYLDLLEELNLAVKFILNKHEFSKLSI